MFSKFYIYSVLYLVSSIFSESHIKLFLYFLLSKLNLPLNSSPGNPTVPPVTPFPVNSAFPLVFPAVQE